MRDITNIEYLDYLKRLQKSVFKILPLYEEKNEFLPQYCYDLHRKVDKALSIIEPLPHAHWYFETKVLLAILQDDILITDNKSTVRSKTFEITGLIQKQIDEVGRCI